MKLVQRDYDDYDKALMRILNPPALSKHKSNKQKTKKTERNVDDRSGKKRYSKTDGEGNDAEKESGDDFTKDRTAKQDDAAVEVVDGVADAKNAVVTEAVLNNVYLTEAPDYAEDVDDKTASENLSVDSYGTVESDATTDAQREAVGEVAAIGRRD